MFANVKKSYSGVFSIIRLYWKIYGGWRALLISPYFHFAVALTILLAHFWRTDAWWDVPIGVLPNIIGFALGGYAIWLGFGDEKFRDMISEQDSADGPSPYMSVNASFVHFIIIQLLALIVALIAKATHYPITDSPWLIKALACLNLQQDFFAVTIAPVGYGIGFLIFVYALMTAVAATLAIFRVTSWFDKIKNRK